MSNLITLLHDPTPVASGAAYPAMPTLANFDSLLYLPLSETADPGAAGFATAVGGYTFYKDTGAKGAPTFTLAPSNGCYLSHRGRQNIYASYTGDALDMQQMTPVSGELTNSILIATLVHDDGIGVAGWGGMVVSCGLDSPTYEGWSMDAGNWTDSSKGLDLAWCRVGDGGVINIQMGGESGIASNAGNWYRLAALCHHDNNGVSVDGAYVLNGVLKNSGILGTNGWSTISQGSAKKIYIGTGPHAAGYGYNGNVAAVAVWRSKKSVDRKDDLTAEEAATLDTFLNDICTWKGLTTP